MFKSRYLTVRISPTKGGIQFQPNWDCVPPDTCFCTDGCTYCSGDCTNCTATCRGPDSAGAILIDPEGQVEMMLDLKGLQAIVQNIELEAEKVQKKAVRARKTKRR
jgi:hypothetical protein